MPERKGISTLAVRPSPWVPPGVMVKFVVSEEGRLVSDGSRMMMWSRVAGNFWAMIFFWARLEVGGVFWAFLGDRRDWGCFAVFLLLGIVVTLAQLLRGKKGRCVGDTIIRD